ncbi:MAG: hypothetical protein WA989_01530, partial [Henriciella sp.]|uniref:hypothetical protein n=1 Tax=Henriciella sp. TaxID=1968823 RepID=UPI003C713A95
AITARFDAEPRLRQGIVPSERAALMLDSMNAQAIRTRAGASRIELPDGLDARVCAVLADLRDGTDR